jgi:hypothetical protein
VPRTEGFSQLLQRVPSSNAAATPISLPVSGSCDPPLLANTPCTNSLDDGDGNRSAEEKQRVASYSKDWRKLTTSYRPQISVQDTGITHNVDPENLLMTIKVQMVMLMHTKMHLPK